MSYQGQKSSYVLTILVKKEFNKQCEQVELASMCMQTQGCYL